MKRNIATVFTTCLLTVNIAAAQQKATPLGKARGNRVKDSPSGGRTPRFERYLDFCNLHPSGRGRESRRW